MIYHKIILPDAICVDLGPIGAKGGAPLPGIAMELPIAPNRQILPMGNTNLVEIGPKQFFWM